MDFINEGRLTSFATDLLNKKVNENLMSLDYSLHTIMAMCSKLRDNSFNHALIFEYQLLISIFTVVKP